MLLQAQQNMLTQDVSNSGKSGRAVFSYKQMLIKSVSLDLIHFNQM